MKKLLSILIITSMLCSFSVSASGIPQNYAHMLKELGIMQGDPNGNMRYDDFVSRAECVKIAVTASSFRDSVATGSKTSPFSDVTYSHWAAPYITVGVKNGLCKGYLDATFRPDETVLYEEAATMFLRILGYTDEDFGGSWPDGQVGIAKNIGILDNIDKAIGDELTRKDMAIIVFNTLNTKSKNFQTDYISSFERSIVEDVSLIATNKEDSSVAKGKIFTSNGTYKYADSFDLSYIGQRGDIVLRDGDTLVSFIPQSTISHTDSYMVYSILGENIITYNNGDFSQIKLESDTKVYKDSTLIAVNSALSSLKMGDVLKVNYDYDNEIEYVEFSEGTTVGPKTVTSPDWYTVFGADSSVTIMRDGTKATTNDVKTNDIAYFIKELNIALVYSKKVTGIYESATPNKDTPTVITVSGVAYNIEGIDAFSKLSSSGSFNLGDTVTLLLGKSGEVADVVTNSQLSDKVYGFMTEAGSKQTTISGNTVTKPYVKLILPSGEAYEYVTAKDLSDSKMKNSVVCITLENGTAAVTSVSDNDTVSGEFTWNSGTRKIGNSKLASDVEILEVSTTDTYETAITDIVFPQRLNGTKLSANSILYAHKNSDGLIDTLILDDVTGDMYTYGILTSVKTSQIKKENEDGEVVEIVGPKLPIQYEYISNGMTNSFVSTNTIYNASSGQVIQFVSSAKGIMSMVGFNKTTSGKITDVTGSKVTIGGKTYTMSDKVQLYVKKSYEYTMLTLDELKGMMSDYTASIYQDKSESAGGRVRVIVLS